MPKLNITTNDIINLIRQLDPIEIEWLIKDLDKMMNSTEMAINLAKYFADETRYIRQQEPKIHESFMLYVKLEGED